MLRLLTLPHNGGAKDGEFEMSLGLSPKLVGMERMAFCGLARSQSPVLLTGILFANGRRTVTTWLRAAGVSDDYQDYYYFLSSVGRNSKSVATQLVILVLRTLPLPELLKLVIDPGAPGPTKRYGPKVEGADVHHNPTPGPADQPFLYGHVWVTISLALRHPQWGPLALPLRAMLYVRKQTIVTIPSPWDDPERRPSHANRRKALRAQIMQGELFTITTEWSLPRKIIRLAKTLMDIAA